VNPDDHNAHANAQSAVLSSLFNKDDYPTQPKGNTMNNDLNIHAIINAALTTINAHIDARITGAINVFRNEIVEHISATLKSAPAQTQPMSIDTDINAAIAEAIANYDFDDAIEHAVGNYDFDDAIDEAVSNYDFDNAIESACDDFDFDDYIRTAVRNDSTIDSTIDNAVEGYINHYDFSSVLDSAIDNIDCEDLIRQRIADATFKEEIDKVLATHAFEGLLDDNAFNTRVYAALRAALPQAEAN
jgi:hypothetical protein